MPSQEERRLIAISESEVERLRLIAATVAQLEMFGANAVFLRSLADRFSGGIDGAEAHEVSGGFIAHWKPDEIDHGHPLYTGYLKLRQIADENHPRYSEPCWDYHDLAKRLAAAFSEEPS
jgi:hypothetical protein